MSLSRTLLLALALLSRPFFAAAQTLQPRINQAVDPVQLVTLGGNTHPLARPEFDRGAATDDMPVNRMLLVLSRSPEQETALRRLIDDQQDKSSPHYHQWLTPEQYGQQFGPADSDVQAVTDWLAGEGFSGIHTSAGRSVIEFSGTAGMVRRSLHTEIHKFVVDAEEHWANVSDPQIPAALAPVVAGILSLNNFPRQPLSRMSGTFSRSQLTGEVTPLFTFTAGGSTAYAVGPADFGTIYNVRPLWTAGINGSGQTIAVVGETNINIKDVEDFRSMFGLLANDPKIILDGPDPGVLPGEEGEADIDVQWAGATAPNATVDFVISQTTESTVGIDLSALYIIDNNLAPVMSESYGACEASLGVGGNAFYSALWEQGSAQGISIVISAGDNGSAACTALTANVVTNGLGVSGLASTPFNTAVGGTDFNDVSNLSTYWNSTNSASSQASAKSYIPEVPWNDSCASAGLSGCTSVTTPPTNGTDVVAGGGGPSTCGVLSGTDPNAVCVGGYAKPSWQSGGGVPADGVRDIPDIAMFAGNGRNDSVYVFCEADANMGSTSSCDLKAPYQDFQGAGGTSVPAPAFAGIMALVNQRTGARQGNPNYVLYRLASESGTSCTSNSAAVGNSGCVFYDVASGNNSVLCQGGTPNCGTAGSSQYGAMVEPASTTTLAWNAGAGYDLVTGLGSVNANNLVNRWNSVTFTPTTTVLANLSPTTLTHGQSVNLTVNVKSSSGTPTGDVALVGSPGSAALASSTFPLTSGSFSGTTNILPGGTYTVTAEYGGNGTFGASSSSPPIQVTVNKESSKTNMALVTFDASGAPISFTATSAGYGSPYVLRTDVTNSAGQECSINPVPCPTGQVTLTANGRALPNQGSASPTVYGLNSQGYLEDTFIQFPAGSYTLSGSYGGDSSFEPSSTTVPMTITKASTTTTLSPSSTNIQYGDGLSLTATITTQSTGAAPTGSVVFYNGSNALPGNVSYSGTSGTTSGTGFATLQATLALNLAATGNIQANYSGDGNYVAADSARTTVTVTPGFTFSAKPTSFSIGAPGESATSGLSVGLGPGFSGSVGVSCALPAGMQGATCTASPSSLSASGSATLTVATTAPSGITRHFPDAPHFPTGVKLTLICVLLLLWAGTARRRRRLAVSLVVGLLLTATWTACGGGSSGSGSGGGNPGTAPGKYSVVVTATGGAVSHSVTLTVNVQ